MPLIEPFRWKTPVSVPCQQCGGTMLLAPAAARTRKYCSKACYYAAIPRRIAEGTFHQPGGARTPEGRQRAREALERYYASHDMHDRRSDWWHDWWADRPYYWVDCTVCGETFPTRAVERPLYCSLACCRRGTYQRYAHAVERICVICGAPFRGHVYRDTLTCGPICGATMQSLSRQRTMQDLILYEPEGADAPFAGPRPHIRRQTLIGSRKTKTKGRRQNQALQDA